MSSTSKGSGRLNRDLSRMFGLGFAGEEKIALTNFWGSENQGVRRRTENFDVAFVVVGCRFGRTRVTANTYEKGPNDMTVEVREREGMGWDEQRDFRMQAKLCRRSYEVQGSRTS